MIFPSANHSNIFLYFRIVSETLAGVEGTRRCFRMVGGILVESTVADVLPELEGTRQRLPDAITALTAQLQEKVTANWQLIHFYHVPTKFLVIGLPRSVPMPMQVPI